VKDSDAEEPLEESSDMLYEGVHLSVGWLDVAPGSRPAKREYRKVPQGLVLASLEAIDSLLRAGVPVGTNLWENWTHKGVKVWEIKAPKQRAQVIVRLLCHKGEGYEFFVALVRQKQCQTLPGSWKNTAANRIKQSIANGGPSQSVTREDPEKPPASGDQGDE
jgi:hypothetical protein